MEQSLQLVRQLVADFKAQERAYLSPSYSESQVRQDFIDKFFTALGWDVTHERQKNPYAQEVRIENKVSMESSQRRADYAFSIDPNFEQVKFFVEAKKPSRSLTNADDYFQAIRYAWNVRTPIVVLTDFEEFHILDSRHKPNVKTALERKIAQYHYSDYANDETFAKIFHLFGREAVAAGSLEKFAATLPKKGTKAAGGFQHVDDAFLEDLDGYREVLAKAFKKTNEQLEGEELTEAIQRTIDRLVFIRFLEDKGIEERQIISLHKQKSAWSGFLSLCKRLEPKYNGLVFKPHRILDSGEFHPPDDHAFGEICQKLSDPSSPYDFNQIPVSILGSIYERFLGKVVHATDKRVKVEEKPEVRKAGGVYYTPEYIVRYIVNETVGKLIEGKTPKQIAEMAFADIACGSGSFLIEVYSELCSYHVRYYADHPDKTGKDDVFLRDGKLHLTLKKKKEILLNTIYGVDIDFQATEVTQLSLYLKMLEDATMNDAFQFGIFKETILPDLKQNIVCGNSLIGRDILEGNLFNDVDETKLKPMNFEDAFPKIMKRGGFDAVVGNPPYLAFQEGSKAIKAYFGNVYRSSKGKYDQYVLFIERSLALIKNSAYFSYIIPNKFIHSNYGEGVKKVILAFQIIEIMDFNDIKVFSNVTNYPCILIISKTEPRKDFEYKTVSSIKESEVVYSSLSVNQQRLTKSAWILIGKVKDRLYQKLMREKIRLGDISSSITQGIRTGSLEVYFNHITPDFIKDKKLEKTLFKPIFTGKNIKRYSYLAEQTSSLLLFPYVEDYKTPVKIEKYPHVNSYLLKNKNQLLERKDSGKIFRETKKEWFEFWDSKPTCFQNPKIVFPDISQTGNFYLDKEGIGYLNTCYGIFLKPDWDYNFILGILNSKVITYVIKLLSPSLRGGYFRFKTNYVAQFPIPTISMSDSVEKGKHEQIVKLVEQMLNSKQKLAAAKTEAETNRLEQLCESIDRQIDEAVYELYGLTEEEIMIVEGEN